MFILHHGAVTREASFTEFHFSEFHSSDFNKKSKEKKYSAKFLEAWTGKNFQKLLPMRNTSQLEHSRVLLEHAELCKNPLPSSYRESEFIISESLNSSFKLYENVILDFAECRLVLLL